MGEKRFESLEREADRRWRKWARPAMVSMLFWLGTLYVLLFAFKGLTVWMAAVSWSICIWSIVALAFWMVPAIRIESCKAKLRKESDSGIKIRSGHVR